MNRVMKKKTGIHIENWWIIIALFIIHCSLFISPVRAQTFTERLQQDRSGAGKVTVTHSTDIDNLVNGIAPADTTTHETRLTPHASRPTHVSRPKHASRPTHGGPPTRWTPVKRSSRADTRFRATAYKSMQAATSVRTGSGQSR